MVRRPDNNGLPTIYFSSWIPIVTDSLLSSFHLGIDLDDDMDEAEGVNNKAGGRNLQGAAMENKCNGSSRKR